jgi:hypothetical protein
MGFQRYILNRYRTTYGSIKKPREFARGSICVGSDLVAQGSKKFHQDCSRLTRRQSILRAEDVSGYQVDTLLGALTTDGVELPSSEVI